MTAASAERTFEAGSPAEPAAAAAPPARPVALSVAWVDGSAARQRAVDGWLAAGGSARRAVIVDGLAPALRVPAEVPLVVDAAGCPCCAGFLPLQVALVRVLRQHRPEAILLLVASGAHREPLVARLAALRCGVPLAVEHATDAGVRSRAA